MSTEPTHLGNKMSAWAFLVRRFLHKTKESWKKRNKNSHSTAQYQQFSTLPWAVSEVPEN
jgi:hypothetical protein